MVWVDIKREQTKIIERLYYQTEELLELTWPKLQWEGSVRKDIIDIFEESKYVHLMQLSCEFQLGLFRSSFLDKFKNQDNRIYLKRK